MGAYPATIRRFYLDALFIKKSTVTGEALVFCTMVYNFWVWETVIETRKNRSMRKKRLFELLNALFAVALAFSHAQGVGAEDITSPTAAVLSGPLEQERKQLLEKIQGAKKYGIGISSYMVAFGAIENEVKAGSTEAALKSRIESFMRSLESQINKAKELKTNKVGASGRSCSSTPSASASSTLKNATNRESASDPTAELRYDGIYVANTEENDRHEPDRKTLVFYILWFAGNRSNGSARMAIWNKHPDEDFNRFLARAWQISKTGSKTSSGEYRLNGSSIKFVIDQIAYAGQVGPTDLKLDHKPMSNSLRFSVQTYSGPKTPGNWSPVADGGLESAGSNIFRFYSNSELTTMSRQVVDGDERQ